MAHFLLKSSLLIILFLLFNPLNSSSQNLLESRQTSYYTYFYQITNEEAKDIITNNSAKISRSTFHKLVDSVLTDSVYIPDLPFGHYLQAHIVSDQLVTELVTIHNHEIKIFNNSTDLQIKVLDTLGNPIHDAKVKIQGSNIPYNRKTESYFRKKTNKKGLLEVEVNGQVTYQMLNRQYNNSWFNRTTSRFLYKTPFKYVWIPTKYFVNLPYDGIRSLISRYPVNTISSTKWFALNNYEKVACIFDPYYCEDDRFEEKHPSFIAFSKPIYKPSDTVKFKVFITSKKGHPIKKPVQVSLSKSYNKKIDLGMINNYRPGGYEFQFVLSDTLNLTLDKSYDIELENHRGQTYLSESFKYEDYELGKIKLECQKPDDNHYKGKEYKVIVTGKDENDFNLLDGKIRIAAITSSYNKVFKAKEFIPDTLFSISLPLKPEGDTEIIIPDTLFPAANLLYQLHTELLTSDNERLTNLKNISYFHQKNFIDYELINDSIYFNYFQNGVTNTKKVDLCGLDGFENRMDCKSVTLPFSQEVNSFYSGYLIETDSIQQEISLAEEPSLLQCNSDRTSDTLTVIIANPRNITFNYTIYHDNNVIKRGVNTGLYFQEKSRSNKPYHIAVQYLWGGQVMEENYTISFNPNKLNISSTQPPIILPGQKTSIELTVTDQKGNPVKDVDLTAYGITRKFEAYEAPSLPDFSKAVKDRKLINSFSLNDISSEIQQKLPYQQWKSIASLDTIEYYKLLYPGKSIYTYTYFTEDSLTQFAPFVLRDGEFQSIWVIYVDERPVYINYLNEQQPYSFPIARGNHKIEIRTRDKKIVIHNFEILAESKTILSLNDDLDRSDVTILDQKPYLSTTENNNLSKYTFAYVNNYDDNFSYLEQYGRYFWLNNENTRYQQLIGPVYPQYANYHLINNFSTHFNFEPFFEYDFSPSLLKMRSKEKRELNRWPGGYSAIKVLNDQVLTEKEILSRWEHYLLLKKKKIQTPYLNEITQANNGQIHIRLINDDNTLAPLLNVALFTFDDPEFLKISPNNTAEFSNLKPRLYKAIIFLNNHQYIIADSIDIKGNGTNYLQVSNTESKMQDHFSTQIQSIMNTMIQRNEENIYNNSSEKEAILNAYRESFVFQGDGGNVSGFVYDENGEGLPGANVLVKGTNFGTVTDINGFYSLNVPPDGELVFSFVGYEYKEIDVNWKTNINVNLNPEITALEEIVVVGYGTMKSKNLTYAATTVYALQGRAAGITISGDPGGQTNIRIRGINSIDSNNPPLIVIDGVIYSGDYATLNQGNIAHIETLKDESATAIYGAKATNGVILIFTKDGKPKSITPGGIKGASYDDDFFQSAMQSGAIRSNFSDEAYWQPTLRTDKNGKARFDVTFPDDVTNWRTFVLGINGKKQTGISESTVKAFKPLMAQLSLPRFLLQGDTSRAIGKVLNYTPDSVKIKTSFQVNGEEISSINQSVTHSIIDSLTIVASSADSLEVTYQMTREGGFFDGEKRDIPVYPIGLEKTKGQFFSLDQDTTLELTFDSTLGDVHFYASANEIDIYKQEVNSVINYTYECNEQMASKLFALLADQSIAAINNTKFHKDAEIKRLIKKLVINQNEEGFWGWWNKSSSQSWITEHVLNSLDKAKKAGYSFSFNTEALGNNLIYQLERTSFYKEKINLLYIAGYVNNIEIDVQKYLQILDTISDLSLTQKFHLQEIRQLNGLTYSLDSIFKYQTSTLFGNIYFADQSNHNFSLSNRNSISTLLAYNILKRDTLDHSVKLRKMRNYFIEVKGKESFVNTYESAKIIDAILPDILSGNKVLNEPKLIVDVGSTLINVDKFPYDTIINPTNLSISKTGDFPVYLTAYQKYWETKPNQHSKEFEIKTSFENNDPTLKAGIPIKLITKVNMLKEADYLMIEIPIPAGCSYPSKNSSGFKEVHREYYKNKVVIFCTNLGIGEHTFEVELLPRYNGAYTLNPAKIEMMYFPTFYANERVKRISIKN